MANWKFPPVEVPRSRTRVRPGRLRSDGHLEGGVGFGSYGFFGRDTARLVAGWTVETSAIDYYLLQELRALRARSRELCRQNEYAHNFLRAMRRNVVGPRGVSVQPDVMNSAGAMDKLASEALARAWTTWGKGRHCDLSGRLSWLELQNLLIYTAAQDGEFLVRKHRGRGRFGYALEVIDPARLDDRTKWGQVSAHEGNEIRLGVEYNSDQQPVAYWIRDRAAQHFNTYDGGRIFRVPAADILHGFLHNYPDQSRGVPWLHSALRTGKRLDMYESAAMTAAQVSAMTAYALTNKDSLVGDEMFRGGEPVEPGDESSDHVLPMQPGQILDFGDKNVVPLDPAYPHEMYDPFIKSNLRRFSSGAGLSYATLSSDLEGVNYSSIRAGVLEDREEFVGLQAWFIDSLVAPVYRDFVGLAIMSGEVLIGGQIPARPITSYQSAQFQGRRWSWVDPQKDMASAAAGVELATRSRSSIIRESGGEPDQVFAEIAEEQEKLKSLGVSVAPIDKPDNKTENQKDED